MNYLEASALFLEMVALLGLLAHPCPELQGQIEDFGQRWGLEWPVQRPGPDLPGQGSPDKVILAIGAGRCIDNTADAPAFVTNAPKEAVTSSKTVDGGVEVMEPP